MIMCDVIVNVVISHILYTIYELVYYSVCLHFAYERDERELE